MQIIAGAVQKQKDKNTTRFVRFTKVIIQSQKRDLKKLSLVRSVKTRKSINFLLISDLVAVSCKIDIC